MDLSGLVQSAQQGDERAFRQLVDRLKPVVAGTVNGILGVGPDAEDVGQETFIRFYKSLKNFRGDSKVETYITRIAINLSLNELKRRKRKFWLGRSEPLDNIQEKGGSKDFTEENDRRQLVNRALDTLDAKFRTVLVLRLIDGYSVKETAEILKIPAGTVLSRLARAQVKMKAVLESLMEDEQWKKSIK